MITLYAIRYQNPHDGTTRYYRFQWKSQEQDPTELRSACLTDDRKIADNVLKFHSQSRNKPELLTFHAHSKTEVAERAAERIDLICAITQTVAGMDKYTGIRGGEPVTLGYIISEAQAKVLQEVAAKCRQG